MEDSLGVSVFDSVKNGSEYPLQTVFIARHLSENIFK